MIWREAIRFGMVGLAQLVLDWAVFVATSWFGLPVAWANLAGRLSGACLGYVANAHYTFAERRQRALDRATLLRFATVWVSTTVLSTVAVAAVERQAGLEAAWLVKPLVDAALVGLSFLASRHWVYR